MLEWDDSSSFQVTKGFFCTQPFHYSVTMFYLMVNNTHGPLRRCSLCLKRKDKSIACHQYVHMHLCIKRLLGKFLIARKHFKNLIDLNSKGVSNMQTLFNNQNITVVKHNTKTCRLINWYFIGKATFSLSCGVYTVTFSSLVKSWYLYLYVHCGLAQYLWTEC